MHYTGTIWRPPHEMYSAWIEVTQGCSHHQCRFCNLYKDIGFRVSSIDDIIEDFQEISSWYPQARRIFLIGANPFVLSFQRLKDIAMIAHQYFLNLHSLGCFARVTDIALKTDEELQMLHQLGYDELTIGVESGNDEALQFMKKGYTSLDIIEQCQRLDRAGITYHFFYIVAMAGEGKALISAKKTADVFHQLNPKSIIAGVLTIFDNTTLYQDVLHQRFHPASEKEALLEMKTFIQLYQKDVWFYANNISNAVVIEGKLSRNAMQMINQLQEAIEHIDEKSLYQYRQNIHHF